jgi:hypothetical protein
LASRRHPAVWSRDRTLQPRRQTAGSFSPPNPGPNWIFGPGLAGFQRMANPACRAVGTLVTCFTETEEKATAKLNHRLRHHGAATLLAFHRCFLTVLSPLGPYRVSRTYQEQYSIGENGYSGQPVQGATINFQNRCGVGNQALEQRGCGAWGRIAGSGYLTCRAVCVIRPDLPGFKQSPSPGTYNCKTQQVAGGSAAGGSKVFVLPGPDPCDPKNT